MKKYRIGILGLGNVGRGTYDVMTDNADLIKQRLGADYEIVRALEINPQAIERTGIDPAKVTDNADDIIKAEDIDIVVESLGGIEPSTTWMLTAMEHGKSVVTPNKAAVAANFQKLMATSKENDVLFRFEACVGCGIPCLTSILEPLSGNDFLQVSGILNGTTNYILSKMYDEGLDYDVILKDAQEKGFAEADPTADVEGIDCANKLSILISLCFGKYIPPMDIPRTGITGVDKAQIEAARAAGNKIKLLSYASLDENGEVDCYVKPVELPLSHPLSGVNNEYNAIYITGNMVDDVMLYGKGAGPHPTGSAIAGDIISIMREYNR